MKSRTDTNVSHLNPSGKKYYEIFIFSVLMFEFAVLCPSIQYFDSDIATLYYLSYQDMGLNSRLFIGSVFKLFAEYISEQALYNCICVIITCVNAFVALVLGRVFRRSTEDKLNSLTFFLLLFLSSPFSLSFLFSHANFGIFDTYLFLLTVIMLLFVNNKYLKWFIPALSIIAEAIYPGWVFLYMPMIVIIQIYEIYNNKHKKSNIILFFLTLLSTIFSLLYFQFLPHNLDFKTPEAVISFLQHRTDFALDYDVILANYILNVNVSFDLLRVVADFAIVYIPCVLLMTSPLIAVFFSLWLKSYKKAEDKFTKFIIFLCFAAPAIALPILVHFDWDRYISAIFIVQFSLVFYFLNSGFTCVVDTAESIRSYFQRRIMLFIFMIIFMSMMIFSSARILNYILPILHMSDYYYDIIEKYYNLVK